MKSRTYKGISTQPVVFKEVPGQRELLGWLANSTAKFNRLGVAQFGEEYRGVVAKKKIHVTATLQLEKGSDSVCASFSYDHSRAREERVSNVLEIAWWEVLTAFSETYLLIAVPAAGKVKA